MLLDPPRAELRAAIACASSTCWSRARVEEVRALVAQGWTRSLPAMRAHGVPELSAHLRGELTLEEAERRAVLATGQYTKRQATWFRHHPWRTGYVRSVRDGQSPRNFLARWWGISSDLFWRAVDAPHNRS